MEGSEWWYAHSNQHASISIRDTIACNKIHNEYKFTERIAPSFNQTYIYL
jgi:hypothetical protein